MKFTSPALLKVLAALLVVSSPVAALTITNTGTTGTFDWSETTTWQGGLLPGEGDDVVISGMNVKVILDEMSPPLLNSITVMHHATLEVMDPMDPANASGDPMLLELFHLHVMHGASLQIGMPDNRIQGQVTIRLHGDKSTPALHHDHADAGTKVMFSHNGNVDIHGQERSHTWTRLAATAHAGNFSLTVRDHVFWEVGEKIAVSSAGFDVEGFDELFEAQELTISGDPVHQTNPTTGEPETWIPVAEEIQYMHYGEKQCWTDASGKDHCVDTVAEVILLSRNIVVEGHMDASSEADGFGAHIKMHNSDAGTLSRISYVEVRDAGQLAVLGSYPIHFHVSGNSAGSYAIGNSIHRSFNRAITIHGAQGIHVIKNVAFETRGHAIYLEDGTEYGNLIQENCVFNTREQIDDFLDAEDRTPASYWISNPNNMIIGNVAGGSRYAGFWIVPDRTAPGDSSICPRYLPLGEFRDNVAHSNYKYGIEVTRWLPKKAGSSCSDSSEDEPAILANNTIFKNGYNGLRFVGTGGNGAISLDGLVAVDNARTYHTSAALYWGSVSEDTSFEVGVRNAIFVQKSGTYTSGALVGGNDPFTRDPLTAPVRAALKFPSNTDNVVVESSVFINYYQEGWVFDPDRGTSGEGDGHKFGWEIPTKGLTFINSPNKVHFRFEHQGIIVDKDGSITGYPSRIVAASPLYDMSRCSNATSDIATTLHYDTSRTAYDKMFHSVDLLVCDFDYTLRRLGRGEFIPGGSDDAALQVFNEEGVTNEEAVIGYGSKGRYTLVAPTNTTINVRFDQGYLPTEEWYQQISRRYMEDNEFIHFVFHPPSTKAFNNFDVEFDGSTAPAGAVSTAGNLKHVVFEGATEIAIAMSFVDAGPTTSSPTSPPTPAPTSPPSASPSKSPTKSPTNGLPDGERCSRASECASGHCAGGHTDVNGNIVDETVCVHSSLFCRK